MYSIKNSKIEPNLRREMELNFLPGRKYSGSGQLNWNTKDIQTRKFRIDLYRFLRDNIPLMSSCIWTWSRLASAPGRFEIADDSLESIKTNAMELLDRLMTRLYPFAFQKDGGLESFLPFMYSSLFTDGAFAGFVLLKPDMSGIERFQPIDPGYISLIKGNDTNVQLALETENGLLSLDSDDFYYLGLNTDVSHGLGKSILGAVPFVAYIEQQLIDDMRRTTHNAGYHRLHVKIVPPEKQSGESDDAYIGRINEYFDETVSMIRDCELEDNPVTWDNVKIEYIGPSNLKGAGNTWFFNHRAMVEEICCGTNLAPFMLGYSYGTTHNWAQFKYDLVMRQVISVQRQTARFLEWLGNMELALNGYNCHCRWIFDNALTYLASERIDIDRTRIDNLLKLFSAGLLSKEAAQKAIKGLI
jgi:hypothetical protein